MVAPPAFTIEMPVLADAAALAEVHVGGWREAYAGRVPEHMLGAEEQERRRRRWARRLSPGGGVDVRERMRIARDGDGRAAGFCLIGEARDDPSPREVELQALYLRSDLYGSGAARAMVTALLGDRPAYVWVADPNPRAQAFYAKLGFAPDGAATTHPGLEDLREIRMVR